jgi:hypothetical protein
VPKKTWLGLLIIFPIFVSALHFIAMEAVGTVALDSIVERVLAFAGLEKSRMSVVIAPYVLPTIIAALCLFAVFKFGEYERTSFEPNPDIDPRQAFVAILKNKKWIRKHTEINLEKLQHLISNYLAVRLKNQMDDALAQGRLQAWGRKNLAAFEDGPFDKIPVAAWHDAEISFDSSGDRALAKTRVSKEMAYLGIKLNAKQVAKEFRISKRALQ